MRHLSCSVLHVFKNEKLLVSVFGEKMQRRLFKNEIENVRMSREHTEKEGKLWGKTGIKDK